MGLQWLLEKPSVFSPVDAGQDDQKTLGDQRPGNLLRELGSPGMARTLILRHLLIIIDMNDLGSAAVRSKWREFIKGRNLFLKGNLL